VFFRPQEAQERLGRGVRRLAAAAQDARVDRPDLAGHLPHADLYPAGHRPARHQRHQRHPQPRLDHLHHDPGRRRLHVDPGAQPGPAEGVEHVLPAGRAALEHDQRHPDQVGERQLALPQQRVPRRGDQPPVEREQVEVVEVGPRLVRGGDAERQVRVAEQRVLDVALGAGAQPHPDRRVRLVEGAHGVEHPVEGEVLRGGDVDLGRAGAAHEQVAELAGLLQQGDGVREEEFPLARQRRPPPRPALLVVQVHPPEFFLELDQPVPHALLGEVQGVGRPPQAPGPGQLDERGHLVGRERGRRIGHGTTSGTAPPAAGRIVPRRVRPAGGNRGAAVPAEILISRPPHGDCE
jgi:hypothetical protein